MSYILEALKKSDQKRQKGHVPDINTVQSAPPPEDKKKTVWPYFLGGVLLLNAIALAVIIRPNKSTVKSNAIVQNSEKQQLATLQGKRVDFESQPNIALSAATQEKILATITPKSDENMAFSQEERSVLPTSEESAKAPVIHDRVLEEVNGEFTEDIDIEMDQGNAYVSIHRSAIDVAVEEVDIEVAKDLNRDTNQKESQVESVQELAAVGIIEDERDIEKVVNDMAPEAEHLIVPQEDSVIVAEPESIETETLPDEQIEVSKSIPMQQQRHAAPETTTVNQEKTRAQREPLHIMQLPLSVQEELPEFHISAHVYFAKKPASRLASINGKIVREGDRLDSKLKVEEIASDGVIFSYQKYLFHVPIL